MAPNKRINQVHLLGTQLMKRNYKNLPNVELLPLLKKGNEHAFNELYNRYWSILYAYAFRIYTEEKICEDIVQEVFIKLWERAETVTIDHIEGYLFKAIKYKIATHIRDLKFTTVHVEALQNLPSATAPEKPLEYEDLENRVLFEIDKLPPKCKKVFMLSRFEHLSNTEISQKLNISVRTVEKHISEAIKALRVTIKTNHVMVFVMAMFL